MAEDIRVSTDKLIIDYKNTYFQNIFEMVNSRELERIIYNYINIIKDRTSKISNFLLNNRNENEAVSEFIRCLKELLINDIDSIDSEYLNDRELFLKTIEDIYTYFRSMLKFSIINLNNGSLTSASFMDVDNNFNQMILQFYRTIEEKVQGHKNNVYRQLNPGSNACILLNNVEWQSGETYRKLASIPFIDTIMLRSPLLIHTSSNKREGSFDEIFEHPMRDFNESPENWLCYPAKIGESLAFIYFHKDFIASGVSLSNLFQLATEEEIKYKKPNLICLFGKNTKTPGCKFFYDKYEDIYVGQVAYDKKAEYFGYIKKTCLTLHNVSMLAKKELPIHGAMVGITLKNGVTKNVAFLGDSGAGKSESIEALRNISGNEIRDMEIIFDDMGSFYKKDGKVYAKGTEIGAFVRLDDLESGAAYRDMDRSIFFNPEMSTNARVVIPVATYKDITRGVPVDMFLYANNYDENVGINYFNNREEAKPVFVEGKRKALGTTDEKGISRTYFANPFGPVQKQDLAEPLIDEMFDLMFSAGVKVGQIYTQLGIKSSPSVLRDSAKELLKELYK